MLMHPDVIWLPGSQHWLYNIMTWEAQKVPVPRPHSISAKSEFLAKCLGHQNY